MAVIANGTGGPKIAPVNTNYGAGLTGGGMYGLNMNMQNYDPFAGNIYAGIPTTLGQTPYGSQLASAKMYLQSPAQQRVVAAQQAGAQTNAGLGASYANQAAEQAQLQAMQTRAGGLAAALGSFGPEYAKAMSSAYNQGANTIAQLGPGIVSSGGATLQAAQQAAAQATAAKTGGQGQVDSYNVPDITGTLTQTGVRIPGNSLAVSGVNAAQMGLYGAKADEGYALNTVAYYQQQAVNALQQRAAERASIIAQKPELYQSALEAQRQDGYQTQNRIDTLTGQASDWINNRRSMAVQVAQGKYQRLLGVASLEHIDPITGQPIGGYTWADKAHTVAVPFKDLAAWKTAMNKNAITKQHYADMASHWTDMAGHWTDITNAYRSRTTAMQKAANAKAALAKDPGKFDPRMSAAVHYISDGLGRPILASSKDGQPVPYSTPGKPVKPIDPVTMVKIAGTLASVADNFKNGVPATTKSAGAKPIDIKAAIGEFEARGYFTNPRIRAAAMLALQNAYGLSQEQIIGVTQGIDPAQGGAYAAPKDITGQQPGAYGPVAPAGIGQPQHDDPRFTPGKVWDPKVDPPKSYAGNLIITQSGRAVERGQYVAAS